MKCYKNFKFFTYLYVVISRNSNKFPISDEMQTIKYEKTKRNNKVVNDKLQKNETQSHQHIKMRRGEITHTITLEFHMLRVQYKRDAVFD